jgi:hypothetical protein
MRNYKAILENRGGNTSECITASFRSTISPTTGGATPIAKLGELLERLKVVLADQHIAGESVEHQRGD